MPFCFFNNTAWLKTQEGADFPCAEVFHNTFLVCFHCSTIAKTALHGALSHWPAAPACGCRSPPSSWTDWSNLIAWSRPSPTTKKWMGQNSSIASFFSYCAWRKRWQSQGSYFHTKKSLCYQTLAKHYPTLPWSSKQPNHSLRFMSGRFQFCSIIVSSSSQ